MRGQVTIGCGCSSKFLYLLWQWFLLVVPLSTGYHIHRADNSADILCANVPHHKRCANEVRDVG